jgi:competence protein ComEA
LKRILKDNKGYITVALLIIAAIGGVSFLYCEDRNNPLSAYLPPEEEDKVELHVSGDCDYPGVYFFSPEAQIGDIIRSCGGNSKRVDLRFPLPDEAPVEQKVNLNTAPSWLLCALPGIGEKTAQEIISYRQTKGLFHSIEEIVNVKGIGERTFENIKHKITVVD